MKIKEIYYEASRKISENFNSYGKAVGLTVSVDDQEDPDVVYGKLKKLVHTMLVETTPPKAVEPSKN